VANESKQGINGKSLHPVSTVQGQLGSPVFALYVDSTISSGAATTDIIFDANCPFAMRIVDFRGILTENSANKAETVKLTDGTSDITDTISIAAAGSDNDTDIFRAGEIDDAYATLKKGDSLKLVKGATAGHVISLDAYVLAVRV
jgi:hypothetical protein